MTKSTLLLTILALCLHACKNDTEQPVDYVLLQQKMDNDPDVLNCRKIFKEYTLILASFPPGESAPLHKKLQSCAGFYTSKLSIPEIEKCLKNEPNAEKFIESKKFQAEVLRLGKIIADRYSALNDLDPIVSGRMVLGTFSSQDAEEMLAVQQKARNLNK